MILEEGRYATVSDAMGLVGRASRHLDKTLGSLKHCRLSVDDDSFKNAQYYLDKIHADLSVKLLDHVDAKDAQKAGA